MNQGMTLDETTRVRTETIELDDTHHTSIRLYKPPDGPHYIDYAIVATLYKNDEKLESEMDTTSNPDWFAHKAAGLVEQIYGRYLLNWEPPRVDSQEGGEFQNAMNIVQNKVNE